MITAWSEPNRTLTFSLSDELSQLDGQPQLPSKDYSFTITASVGNHIPVVQQVQFKLRVMNPCLPNSKVSVIV